MKLTCESPLMMIVIAAEQPPIELESTNTYRPDVAEEFQKRRFIIKFGQTYISSPYLSDHEGESGPLFPHDARLRNLTYSCPLHVDVHKDVYIDPENNGSWEHEASDMHHQLFIGRVPVMLRSEHCNLNGKTEAELQELGECPYDPVRRSLRLSGR